MITGFADKETAKVAAGEVSRKLPREIQEGARIKLRLLDAAVRMEDLWAVPSLHAEKLVGKRKGQWSIRINKQWRICFAWDEVAKAASAVEIVDCH